MLSSDSDSSCTDQADSIVVEYDDFMKVWHAFFLTKRSLGEIHVQYFGIWIAIRYLKANKEIRNINHGLQFHGYHCLLTFIDYDERCS